MRAGTVVDHLGTAMAADRDERAQLAGAAAHGQDRHAAVAGRQVRAGPGQLAAQAEEERLAAEQYLALARQLRLGRVCDDPVDRRFRRQLGRAAVEKREEPTHQCDLRRVVHHSTQ
jgi:hypothetical protein